jgi:hypothetical protein
MRLQRLCPYWCTVVPPPRHTHPQQQGSPLARRNYRVRDIGAHAQATNPHLTRMCAARLGTDFLPDVAAAHSIPVV